MREYRYRVDAEGRVFHDGSEVLDPLTLRFFLRAMTRTPEGGWLVVCQGERNWFESEGTPFVVQRVRPILREGRECWTVSSSSWPATTGSRSTRPRSRARAAGSTAGSGAARSRRGSAASRSSSWARTSGTRTDSPPSSWVAAAIPIADRERTPELT